MKIFSSEQIREIDSYTIKNEPVESVDLMERAALALSYWFRVKYDSETRFVFLAGPGNNGGDAWALARLLFQHGFENMKFYLLNTAKNISPDSMVNRHRFAEETNLVYKIIESEDDFPTFSKDAVIVDGLFGSGLSRSLDGMALKLVTFINNALKKAVVSIDIPSGLFGEDNRNNYAEGIVRADITLSFQFPKLAFFLSDNVDYIGNWEVLPIGLHPEAIEQTKTIFSFLEIKELKKLLRPRKKYSHKGTYGHALIIAGSYGMMGAAVLATKAAVRSGAGLVTVHMPHGQCGIIQTTIPEALTSIDESDIMFTRVNNIQKYSAIGIGPGLNTKSNTVKGVKELIEEVNVPLVIDADAINIISQHKELLDIIPPNTILTPHPGEFDRLTDVHSSHLSRIETQQMLSTKHKIIIVLKGAHSSISFPDGSVWFNTTGNPGMAKGGSGDILTGIICSLLAQGYSPEAASKLGVFVHGLAGDIAGDLVGYQALIPSDVVDYLGRAFIKLEN